MKKLKLNLDEIKVESFETNFNVNKKGTANGFVTGAVCIPTEGYQPTCDYPSCNNTRCGSCDISCNPGSYTCNDSCNNSCYPTDCSTEDITCP